MYSFIFGFHRFVWWPKCTPASSRSFIAIAANSPPLFLMVSVLPFTELEPLARSSHAVLLAFLRARVAGEQTVFLELLAQLQVVFHKRPRDPEANRSCL